MSEKPGWKRLNAIVNLRRRAADVVVLCDMATYQTAAAAQVACSRLPRRMRALQVALQHAQEALEEDRP